MHQYFSDSDCPMFGEGGQVMSDQREIGASFIQAVRRSHREEHPYRHWLLADVLPEDVRDALLTLPFTPPGVIDTKGKRETNNATRVYFDVGNRERLPVCQDVAEAFQSQAVTRFIEEEFQINLRGTFLRIEYCQDTEGFWLEPHTDIGVKKYTMLLYLSKDPGSETWGTDVLAGPLDYIKTAPFQSNGGLIFVPASNTWHGFRPRPINGVRRSIIINYVTDEWRARHELAYPSAVIQ
ncbi:2OG-Fe(II) oxygenase [Azospirillaceae bacterium]